MVLSNFESFLKTGSTFKVLRTEVKTPVRKKRLNKFPNCFKISLVRRNDILQGTLFGPGALLELKEDIMSALSSLSVGCGNVVLLLSFER